MRPKLVHDFFYVRLDGGAYLKSSSGTLNLRGHAVYDWIDRLAPLLDGEHSMSEIVAGASAERRGMIEQLVDVLARNGMVTDREKQQPHGLTGRELDVYAEEIAFLDSVAGSGAHRFERFRYRPVLVTGSGTSLTALTHAVLQLGAAEVDVSVDGDDTAAEAQRRAELLALLRKKDPRLRLGQVPALTGESVETIRRRLDGYAAVIHCADHPSTALVGYLNRAVAGTGTALLQSIVAHGAVWLGPMSTASPGCWECAWRRRLGGPAADGPGRSDPLFTGPLCAIATHSLVFEWFTRAADARSDGTDPALVRIDLETAQTTRHRFHPHPLCTVCRPVAPSGREPVAERLAELRARGALTEAEFSRRAAALFDPYVGVFRSLDEGSAAQLPLHTAVVTLAGPIDGATRTVVAVDTSFPAARRHATVAACETYATALLGATRLGRGSWWGWNATTAQAAALPPVSAAGAPSVAAGLTWSEAVVRGVLRQLHALPEESGAELSDAEHSTETARLLSIARVLTPTLTWSVTNALPRVVAVDVHAGAVHARSCALDVDTALRGALSEVVARCQGVTPSEGSLTVPPVCGPADADLVASDLIGHVRDAGWDVWVAPVDEDAAVAAAMPYLAAVALIPAG